MKPRLRPLAARRYVAIVGLLAALGIAGLACDGTSGDVVIYDGLSALATIENQSPDTVVVEPFGDVLFPGEAVDYDLGGDIVHTIVVRDFDGLVLLETDLAAGDVWIIQ